MGSGRFLWSQALSLIHISQDAISNIESGARLVMDYELRAFASVLQVPIEDLLDPEEE